MQELPAVGGFQQPTPGAGGRQGLDLDAVPVPEGQPADGPHGERRGVEPLHRRQMLLQLRPYPSQRLPRPGQLVQHVRPQPQAGEGGQRHRAAVPVQDHAGHVVGQHGVAALDERRDQRRLAGARTAREQHRAGSDPDGAGMKGHDAPLLQQGGEHRAGEKDAYLVVAAAARLDEDVAAVRDPVAGDAGHVQQEGAGGGFPQAVPVGGRGERRRRRADADRHVRFAVRKAGKGGEERQGEGRAHVQPIRRIAVLRTPHSRFSLVPTDTRFALPAFAGTGFEGMTTS